MKWTDSWDKKILLLISIVFLVRLFHITEPPVETSHNWRQTTSLMVARNFYQGDPNVLYPTIDECGNRRGVIGMEFPALPYSIYLVSKVAGYDHWYGRLINLIVVSVGTWFFFLLLCIYFDQRFAFIATISYIFSALFHLSRKVLPDPMSLSLVVIGVYYGMTYLRNGHWWRVLFYVLFAGLGTLVKIPFGLFLVVLAIPFINKKYPVRRKMFLALASVIILLTTYWWYFIWNVHLSDTFGQWYNSGRSLGEGFRELSENLPGFFEKFYFSAFHSYLFCATALVGLFLVFYRKNKQQLWLLTLLLPLIAVYVIKSGFLFAHHGYYALVLMPLMALLIATALNGLSTKWTTLILTICIVESVANQQHDFFIKEKEYVKVRLGEVAEQVSLPSDLVALASNENPNEFYFLNRKGWLVMKHELNLVHLAGLRDQGCRYLFMRKGLYDTNLRLETVFENHDYIVFKL